MKTWKQKRALSFGLIACIYAAATALGLWVYRLAEAPWWLALLAADVAATVFVYVWSVLLGNASVYDPYWSVQPPVILAACAVGHRLTALGVLLLAVVWIWGVRLTANWAYTFGNLTCQDWRYTMLREKTGRAYPLVNFVGIHMVPTLVVWGCVLPAVWASLAGLSLTWGSAVCLAVSLGAVVMQGTADVQMHRFRRHRTGTFIRVGLWKYARHPNYLGEILMWWGVALAVTSASPRVWYLSAGALANTVLFLAVSIPMAEGKQSRKPGYEAYRAETRMLLPLPKKKPGTPVEEA